MGMWCLVYAYTSLHGMASARAYKDSSHTHTHQVSYTATAIICQKHPSTVLYTQIRRITTLNKLLSNNLVENCAWPT